MASARAHSDDDRLDQSPESDSVQSQMAIQTVPYTGLPMHMYPFAPGVVNAAQPPIRSKRRQVKNACTNCQKACKKCDDARPCLRCVKYGIGEECVDSQRKERKKGIKRGPYKKRDGKSRATSANEAQLDPVAPPHMGTPFPGVPPASGTPPAMSFMNPVGYPPPVYGQYAPPLPPMHKPGEAPTYYPPPYYMVQPPPPPPPNQEHEGGGYPPPPPHHQYYPGYLPYGSVPYPNPYLMPHHRPDMQVVMQPNGQYAGYPRTATITTPTRSLLLWAIRGSSSLLPWVALGGKIMRTGARDCREWKGEASRCA
ncbi:hypothetical protein BC834DRAFT_1043205 [Gloeopeniophorella convolvens]|nr:hypothetical protein BC834DRAFT_1043205 [Gloeopeniophorella convolvens]